MLLSRLPLPSSWRGAGKGVHSVHSAPEIRNKVCPVSQKASLMSLCWVLTRPENFSLPVPSLIESSEGDLTYPGQSFNQACGDVNQIRELPHPRPPARPRRHQDRLPVHHHGPGGGTPGGAV